MTIELKAAVITVSDTRTSDDDPSGSLLKELLVEMGSSVVGYEIVTDDLAGIRSAIAAFADRSDVNLVLTTGGTGFGPRDNTPEATREVIDREAPGIAEAIRRETASKTPMAMLSRGIAGIRNSTVIINLPGSPKAVEECFAIVRPVLAHAVQLVSGHTTH